MEHAQEKLVVEETKQEDKQEEEKKKSDDEKKKEDEKKEGEKPVDSTSSDSTKKADEPALKPTDTAKQVAPVQPTVPSTVATKQPPVMPGQPISSPGVMSGMFGAPSQNVVPAPVQAPQPVPVAPQQPQASVATPTAPAQKTDKPGAPVMTQIKPPTPAVPAAGATTGVTSTPKVDKPIEKIPENAPKPVQKQPPTDAAAKVDGKATPVQQPKETVGAGEKVPPTQGAVSVKGDKATAKETPKEQPKPTVSSVQTSAKATKEIAAPAKDSSLKGGDSTQKEVPTKGTAVTDTPGDQVPEKPVLPMPVPGVVSSGEGAKPKGPAAQEVAPTESTGKPAETGGATSTTKTTVPELKAVKPIVPPAPGSLKERIKLPQNDANLAPIKPLTPAAPESESIDGVIKSPKIGDKPPAVIGGDETPKSSIEPKTKSHEGHYTESDHYADALKFHDYTEDMHLQKFVAEHGEALFSKHGGYGKNGATSSTLDGLQGPNARKLFTEAFNIGIGPDGQFMDASSGILSLFLLLVVEICFQNSI